MALKIVKGKNKYTQQSGENERDFSKRARQGLDDSKARVSSSKTRAQILQGARDEFFANNDGKQMSSKDSRALSYQLRGEELPADRVPTLSRTQQMLRAGYIKKPGGGWEAPNPVDSEAPTYDRQYQVRLPNGEIVQKGVTGVGKDAVREEIAPTGTPRTYNANGQTVSVWGTGKNITRKKSSQITAPVVSAKESGEANIAKVEGQKPNQSGYRNEETGEMNWEAYAKDMEAWNANMEKTKATAAANVGTELQQNNSLPEDEPIPDEESLRDEFFGSERGRIVSEIDDATDEDFLNAIEAEKFRASEQERQAKNAERASFANAAALQGNVGGFGFIGNAELVSGIQREGRAYLDRLETSNAITLQQLMSSGRLAELQEDAAIEGEVSAWVAGKQDQKRQENADRWNKFLQIKGLEMSERAEARAESAEERAILQQMFSNQLAVNVETRAQQEFESSQAKAAREEVLAQYNLPLDMFDKAIKATGNRQGSIAYVTQAMSNLGMEVDPAIFEKPGGMEGVVSTLSQLGIKEWTPAVAGAVMAQYGNDLSAQERAIIKAAGDSWGAMTPLQQAQYQGALLGNQQAQLQMRQLIEENGWDVSEGGFPIANVPPEGGEKLQAYLNDPNSVPMYENSTSNGGVGYNCVLWARSIVGEENCPPGMTTYTQKLNKINSEMPVIGGTAVINTGDSTGHIAIVTNVLPDGRVEITESNWNGPISVRTDTPENLNIQGYIAGQSGSGNARVDEIVNSIMSPGSSLKPNQVTNKNLKDKVQMALAAKRDELLATGDFVNALRASAGGERTGEGLRTKVGKAFLVVDQLEALKSMLIREKTNDAVTNVELDLSPISGQISKRNPWNGNAQTVQAALYATIPNLARGVYGEVGVLTDNDVALYSKTIPNLTQTDDVKRAVLALTLKTIRNGVKRTLQSEASGGIDVSGYVQQYEELEKKIKEIESSLGIKSSENLEAARQESMNQAAQRASSALLGGSSILSKYGL